MNIEQNSFHLCDAQVGALEIQINRIDDSAKDDSNEFLPRCTAFFNRIPTESVKICNSTAMQLSKKFL